MVKIKPCECTKSKDEPHTMNDHKIRYGDRLRVNCLWVDCPCELYRPKQD